MHLVFPKLLFTFHTSVSLDVFQLFKLFLYYCVFQLRLSSSDIHEKFGFYSRLYFFGSYCSVLLVHYFYSGATERSLRRHVLQNRLEHARRHFWWFESAAV